MTPQQKQSLTNEKPCPGKCSECGHDKCCDQSLAEKDLVIKELKAAMKSGYEALDDVRANGVCAGKLKDRVLAAITNIEKYFPHTKNHEDYRKQP